MLYPQLSTVQPVLLLSVTHLSVYRLPFEQPPACGWVVWAWFCGFSLTILHSICTEQDSPSTLDQFHSPLTSEPMDKSHKQCGWADFLRHAVFICWILPPCVHMLKSKWLPESTHRILIYIYQLFFIYFFICDSFSFHILERFDGLWFHPSSLSFLSPEWHSLWLTTAFRSDWLSNITRLH